MAISYSYADAIMKMIEGYSFCYYFCYRMEKLKRRSKSSQAKSLGTIVSIAGTFVVTFYKGPPIARSLSDIASLYQIQSLQSNWILGGFCLAAQAILISAWYILQVGPFTLLQCWGTESDGFYLFRNFFRLPLKEFPALIVMLCYQYFFSTILAAALSLTVVTTELSAWKLRLDIGLFAIAYSVSIWIPLPSILDPKLYIEFESVHFIIYLRLSRFGMSCPIKKCITSF